ncbi:hypothetical protein BRY73_23490 [Ochrobactrum sp. P6BS-III]|nr:hypothetical protein [Ochrobactrum sp. P6BSIII]OOL14607.1 hypothetical protein BRY73_23490 [Ochrobactrum sp. P6BS-III]
MVYFTLLTPLNDQETCNPAPHRACVGNVINLVWPGGTLGADEQEALAETVSNVSGYISVREPWNEDFRIRILD